MKNIAAALVVFFAAQTPALAQGLPTERVTVTGAREAAIEKFIRSRAAVTRMTGKVARWKVPVCPVVYGIPPAYGDFIVQRVRAVAVSVGAPVNTDEECRGNVQIVFTTAPQALLDNIRSKYRYYLGYHDNTRQADAMTRLKRPVHAFYTTSTVDLRGNRQVDSAKTMGIEIQLPGVAGAPAPGEGTALPPGGQMVTLNLPGASAMSVSGTRFLGDGLASELQHVVMVVDTQKVLPLEMGALADNIALQALSQPNDLDTCQDLASIANLTVAPACDPATMTDALSAHDSAYLRGLYKSQIDGAGRVQKAQISYQMKQAAPEE